MWWHTHKKPDFVFRRNGRVHLNRQGRQFSRLLAAELCSSAVVILDSQCSGLPTPFASFPFTSPPVRHRVPSHFNWNLLEISLSTELELPHVRLYFPKYLTHLTGFQTIRLAQYKPVLLLLLFSTYSLQPSRLTVRSGLDVPTFATRRLHVCHHARAPSGGRWNCGREMSGNFA